MKKYKLQCKEISKIYDLNKNKTNIFSSIFKIRRKGEDKFYALHNISFTVYPGMSIGILGINGSGKSTLSNILGGIVEPTNGVVNSDTQPSLIAINAGLNNDFTGEENIKFKCLMHGMSKKDINHKFDKIVEFSELGKFISQPLKTYSSGMRSRLGFSIAIHTNPDILIVDEALSVGDETFSNKCIKKMKELQDEGKTIFFVSHSIKQISKLCDTALWLHYGELLMYDDAKIVINQYKNFISDYNSKTKEEQMIYKKTMIKKQKNSKDNFKRNKKSNSNNTLVMTILLLLLLLTIILQLSY